MPYYEDIVHLCDIPRYHAKHNPDEIAFIYEDKQTTYKDFDLKTEKLQMALLLLVLKIKIVLPLWIKIQIFFMK